MGTTTKLFIEALFIIIKNLKQPKRNGEISSYGNSVTEWFAAVKEKILSDAGVGDLPSLGSGTQFLPLEQKQQGVGLHKY